MSISQSSRGWTFSSREPLFSSRRAAVEDELRIQLLCGSRPIVWPGRAIKLAREARATNRVTFNDLYAFNVSFFPFPFIDSFRARSFSMLDCGPIFAFFYVDSRQFNKSYFVAHFINLKYLNTYAIWHVTLCAQSTKYVLYDVDIKSCPWIHVI